MTDQPITLTPEEKFLLVWLGEDEFSQYGECNGANLDSLVAKGLAQIHGPGEHQHFIANDHEGTKGMMYRAVSLTETGRMYRAAIKGE
jgi:hypothetical protein